MAKSQCQQEKVTTSVPNKLNMDFKIATLNLCLGLNSTKNLIKETILREKIDILCMQETEINKNLDYNLLSFPGFTIETENNTSVSRVAFYISKVVEYIRRTDLEGDDSNLIIIDIMGSVRRRIINVYGIIISKFITSNLKLHKG